MTKSFLLTALASFAGTGVATAQSPPTPTSTPPAPIQRVAFKQVMPAAEAPAEQNIRIQVRLITLPVGNVVVKELFAGGRESDMPKPVILTKDGLHAFREKLAGERQAVVLQAPRMNHFDRQPMDFRCGDDVSFDTAGGKVKVFVGTACKLTPTIGEEGKTVKLAVDLTSTERNGGPPTDVRNFKSLSVKREFAIPVGGTAAMKLGTRKVTTRYEFGPPVLSQIPYLNRLFKNVGIGEVESDVVAVFTVEEIIPLGDEEIIPVAKLTPAAPKMYTKVFSVGDLVCPPTESPLAKPGADSTLRLAAELYTGKRAEQLQTMIRELVKPYSWEEKGGAGRLDYYATGNALVVNGEQKVVEEVGELLASLERCQAGKPGECWEHLRANSGSGVMRTPEPTPKFDPHVFVQMTLFSATSDHPAVRKLLEKSRETPLTPEEVKATLIELKKDGAVEIHSRPQLMLRDKQTGFFQIGQQFPRLSGTTHPDTGKPQQGVEYINTGTVVRMTPDVSADRKSVRLRAEISMTEPSTSRIDLGNGQFATPIDCQAVESTLVLPDGGTMAVNIGTKKVEHRLENKVPFLGDLPYVGRLFRNVGVSHERRDTIAVVTVTGVNSAEQHQQLVNRVAASVPRTLSMPVAAAPVPVPPPAVSLHKQVTPIPMPIHGQAVAPQVIRVVGLDGLERIGVEFDLVQASGSVPVTGRVTGGGAAIGGFIGHLGEAPSTLMTAYHAACAAGKKDEAARLALQLLANDPTCFGRGK